MVAFPLSRVAAQLRNSEEHVITTTARDSAGKGAMLGASDGRWRSVVKALSWRLVASAVTVTVVWVVTGKMEVAAVIGAGDTLVKILLYYFHERAWIRIGFGQSTQRIGS